MLAAASSFFAGSNISKQYAVGGSPTPAGARPGASTPGAGAPGPSTTIPHAPTFRVGPWRVQSAAHKTTGKRVSIWDLDKRSPWLERLNPPARERAMEVLKGEVRACLLESTYARSRAAGIRSKSLASPEHPWYVHEARDVLHAARLSPAFRDGGAPRRDALGDHVCDRACALLAQPCHPGQPGRPSLAR
jgi:hypothetical protein